MKNLLLSLGILLYALNGFSQQNPDAVQIKNSGN